MLEMHAHATCMHHVLHACTVLCASSCLMVPMQIASSSPPRPHLVLALADDMGWNDAGFTRGLAGGGDLEGGGHPAAATPTLDALAAGGVVLARPHIGIGG